MRFPALYPGDPFVPLQLALRRALEDQGIGTSPGGRGYRVAGRRPQSVTELLDDGRGRFIPQGSCDRGTTVHRAVEDLLTDDCPGDCGLPYDGWLEAWDRFVAWSGFVALVTEAPICGEAAGAMYCGTPDVIGTRRRWDGLHWREIPLETVELKSGPPGRSADQQAGGYLLALACALGWRPPLIGTVVGLDPSGDFDPTRRRHLRPCQMGDVQGFMLRADAREVEAAGGPLAAKP